MSASPAPRGRRLWLALPVSGGLGLVAVVVLLVLSRRADLPAPRAAAAPPVRSSPPPAAPAPDNPLEVPPGFVRETPRPRPGPGIQRWGMDTLPPEWDAELAEKIAEYFSRMQISTEMDKESFTDLADAREELREFLSKLGPEAIPTLAQILRAEPDFVHRRFLIYALGDLGQRSEDATFALLDFYEDIRDQHGARSETNHVIQAMSRLKNETSYQAMSRYIDEPSTGYDDRDKLIQALGDHPRREESLGRFVHHGREDPHLGTRNHSWQAVGKMGPRARDALPDLISAFEGEDSVYVRQTILGSIGKIGDAAALSFLEKKARTAEPWQVRLSAASAIRRIGGPQAPRLLRSIQAGEREESMRKHIEKWLGETS